MFKSIMRIAAVGASAGLLFGASAMAEQDKAQIWAPPAEISGKPAPDAAPAPNAPPAAATPAPAHAMTKAEKEKACATQANSKGLRKHARWSFITECMKN